MRQSLLFLSALASSASVVWNAAPLSAAVVISEIHYNPPAMDYRRVELVELQNTGSSEVDVGGWALVGGARFTIPVGPRILPGGFLVIAKSADAVRERFPGAGNAVVGDFDGFLDNSGDSVTLLDAQGAYVDGVSFDDKAPWPEDADGKGKSLQRVCASAPSWEPLNWTAANPTPGGPNPAAACPPPAFVAPRVTINELQYKPKLAPGNHPSVEDGEDAEYIEIYNPGANAIDLSHWRLADGIDLEIPEGTLIPPDGYLVAGRDPVKLQAKLGITNIIAAGYLGRLSNGGERVALLDAQGVRVDSVLYSDSGEWPYGADGVGRSLERVSETAPASDPANWKTSALSTNEFQTLVGEGPAGQGLGQKFLLSLDGPGKVLVDNVLLEDITTAADVKVVLEDSFNDGISADWKTAEPPVSTYVHAPNAGAQGTGALLLTSTAACPNGECGSSYSVSRTITGLNRQGKFRVTVVFKAVSGSPLFSAGLFKGAGVSVDEVSSPGKPNTVRASEVPPFITQVRRFPLEPRSTDAPWITALVRARSAAAVTLEYSAKTGGIQGATGTLTMLDDGQHGDHLAGDGVFGVNLPAFLHDTQVRFRIRAVVNGAGGEKVAEYPVPLNVGAPLPEEVAGYYVNDLQPDTELPVEHILIDSLHGNGIDAVNALLKNCEVTVPASFAFKGELFPDVHVRFRGNTACYVKKRNFKVTFNRGRFLGALKKINLNSEWTDKAMVREYLAWNFMGEIGTPYMASEFVRLHVNGGYFGLFLYIEHPDGEFLDRNHLDSNGNLYKAKQPPNDGRFPVGVAKQATREDYRDYWEEETNEGGDFADIQLFIDDMHKNGARLGGPTADFFQLRTLEEMLIGYQVGQVVLNNIDSFAKNHFLYHDFQSDKWGFITWDLDLTFGKWFTPAAVDQAQGREVGTLNDLLLCSPEVDGDLNPWFAATVLQNQLLNYFVDFFFRAGRGFYQRAYLIRLWDILQEKFRNETYDPRIDAIAAYLSQEEQEDRARWGRFPSNVPGWPEDMARNIPVVKQQLGCHRDFLISYLKTFNAAITTHPRMKITEVMYLPEGGSDDLEFLEIQNTGAADVTLTGWGISGLGKDNAVWLFPDDAIVTAGETFIVAKSPDDFRSRYSDRQTVKVFGPYPGKLDNEGEELRLLDAGPGYPATVDYLKYSNDAPWPDVHPGHSIELTEVSLDRDNDLGENWRESILVGGTPGATSPVFIRSNANGDAKVDLTDVVFLLSYLFRGGPAPACLDAGDADDDGKVGISDAIRILQHLFQGGSPPPAPYPDPGMDPTPDFLGC